MAVIAVVGVVGQESNAVRPARVHEGPRHRRLPRPRAARHPNRQRLHRHYYIASARLRAPVDLKDRMEYQLSVPEAALALLGIINYKITNYELSSDSGGLGDRAPSRPNAIRNS